MASPIASLPVDSSWDEIGARLRDRALSSLQWHWGSAYVITWADGVYIAQRRDTRATLRANTPELLLGLIGADYQRQPVPREFAPPETE